LLAEDVAVGRSQWQAIVRPVVVAQVVNDLRQIRWLSPMPVVDSARPFIKAAPAPLLSALVAMALMRKRRVFTGLNVEVAVRRLWLCRQSTRNSMFASRGCLLTWLSAPPVEPRPNSMDDPRSSPS
jgi:hypothetical protein